MLGYLFYKIVGPKPQDFIKKRFRHIIYILFIRIPSLKKAKKQELPRNHAQAHMQTDLRIRLSNIFFFQTGSVFPPFFKFI